MSEEIAKQKLLNASLNGDIKTVQSCLLAGVDINAMNVNDGVTPLHNAMYNNHTEVVTLLLTKDVDIASSTKDGHTWLHRACSNNSPDVIPLLGKDKRMTKQLLNTKNRFGYTPLMLAVSRGNIACVEQLEKLEWVDWKTTNYRGETLVDVTRYETHLFDINFAQFQKKLNYVSL